MNKFGMHTMRSLCGALVVMAAALGATCATAQVSSAAAPYQEMAQNWLHKALPDQQGAETASLRMEVVFGNLDSRLRLAPCGKVEPYLPVGMRLWGKSQVGLRCTDGVARWNVMLPVTINAYGPAWVVRGQIPAGALLTEADVESTEVNWAAETNPVLAQRGAWEGQVAARTLMSGQVLRQGMVRPAQVFQAGAPVKVMAQGTGFQISADAQALSAGVVGQVARVRMENGRISSGVVLDGKTVQIDL